MGFEEANRIICFTKNLLVMKMKNVIHIYGASGSGITTLGRKISEELGYKFMDTDDYFWLPTNPQ